ncbi:hypothetical protein E2C01_024047 [Portunus trituberculatus]|uniref:Uncharacterized protein n=1 Tax=Portunus trituberculatus TaxID=210409 RepID=A0A5B7EAW2_PORTR|nr:hypothetical protein [Portunus trituberculatus]
MAGGTPLPLRKHWSSYHHRRRRRCCREHTNGPRGKCAMWCCGKSFPPSNKQLNAGKNTKRHVPNKETIRKTNKQGKLCGRSVPSATNAQSPVTFSPITSPPPLRHRPATHPSPPRPLPPLPCHRLPDI